jgi:capsular polysaccharide biosynthesis protein
MNAPVPTRLGRYLTVILRWLAVNFFVFALSASAGLYIINNVMTKVYTATAQIQVPNGDTDSHGGTIFEVMASPEMLLPIIHDLNLDKAWTQQVYVADSDQLPDVDALTHMGKILRIEQVQGTNIFKITASSEVPQEAADIANALADRYKILRDDEEHPGLKESRISSVFIVSRAEAPSAPSRPNKVFDYPATIVLAVILSLMASSFVEVIFLLLRAAERTDN